MNTTPQVDYENTISVLMPVYNLNLEWLDASILSILNQTYENFVFVIVNDGANEEVTERLDYWASCDSRIQIVNNPKNMGITYALNNGLGHIHTKYMARTDSDDISMPDRFERQMKYLKAHPDVSVVGSRAYGINTGNFYDLALSPESVEMALLHDCDILHSAVLLKTQVIKDLGGYCSDFPYAEDYALWCRVILAGHKIANMPDTLMRIRDNHPTVKYGNTQFESAQRIREWYFQSLCAKHGVTHPECGNRKDSTFKDLLKIFKAIDQIADKVYTNDKEALASKNQTLIKLKKLTTATKNRFSRRVGRLIRAGIKLRLY